jgi:hypothetical protein
MLALIEREHAHLCAFFHCNVTLRDRHDDFADQANAVGIGAMRRRPASSSAAAHFSGRHFVF